VGGFLREIFLTPILPIVILGNNSINSKTRNPYMCSILRLSVNNSQFGFVGCEHLEGKEGEEREYRCKYGFIESQ